MTEDLSAISFESTLGTKKNFIGFSFVPSSGFLESQAFNTTTAIKTTKNRSIQQDSYSDLREFLIPKRIKIYKILNTS